MEIELGKKYLNGKGEIIHINNTLTRGMVYIDSEFRLYSLTGESILPKDPSSNLVKQVEDEPVEPVKDEPNNEYLKSNLTSNIYLLVQGSLQQRFGDWCVTTKGLTGPNKGLYFSMSLKCLDPISKEEAEAILNPKPIPKKHEYNVLGFKVIKRTQCITPCPNLPKILIGSWACSLCDFCVKCDKDAEIVVCNYTKE